MSGKAEEKTMVTNVAQQLYIERLESLIEDIHKSCLCKKIDDDFLHNANHSKLGASVVGARWMTPNELIEERVGFKWKYEKPEGVCNSWKELDLITTKKREGYY